MKHSQGEVLQLPGPVASHSGERFLGSCLGTENLPMALSARWKRSALGNRQLCVLVSCLAGIILWPLMSFTILFNVLANLNLAEQDHHFLVKCTLGGDSMNARPHGENINVFVYLSHFSRRKRKLSLVRYYCLPYHSQPFFLQSD